MLGLTVGILGVSHSLEKTTQ